jgi:hypothetical protein
MVGEEGFSGLTRLAIARQGVRLGPSLAVAISRNFKEVNRPPSLKLRRASAEALAKADAFPRFARRSLTSNPSRVVNINPYLSIGAYSFNESI